MSKSILVSCYGFKVIGDSLRIPIGKQRFESISLNDHTLQTLSDPTVKVRSFTLTCRSLSLCISRDVEEIAAKEIVSALGVDVNLRNVAVGNARQVTYYDISKVPKIIDTTRRIVGSFRRNDMKIRKRISSKYGARRKERIKRILHNVSARIAQDARINRQAIVFEELRGIRSMYNRGTGQGRAYRGRMNSWPFGELKRQIQYKAAWIGVPVVSLSRKETRGTSLDCHQCGERLQGSREKPRQLWCENCERWFDRDFVAVINISRRGWLRFGHSEGEANEAVRGNVDSGPPLILRVDASKSENRLSSRIQDGTKALSLIEGEH